MLPKDFLCHSVSVESEAGVSKLRRHRSYEDISLPVCNFLLRNYFVDQL